DLRLHDRAPGAGGGAGPLGGNRGGPAVLERIRRQRRRPELPPGPRRRRPVRRPEPRVPDRRLPTLQGGGPDRAAPRSRCPRGGTAWRRGGASALGRGGELLQHGWGFAGPTGPPTALRSSRRAPVRGRSPRPGDL